MNIPRDVILNAYALTTDTWIETAIKLSMYYGVPIVVKTTPGAFYDRIFFKVMDHEFDNLKDLKVALRNKAFL